MAETITTKPLGEILIEKGLLTSQQLEVAAEESKKTGERLGSVLVKRGLVSQKALGKVLEAQVGISYVHLADEVIDPKVVRMLPEPFIRRHKALPIRRENNSLTVVMQHPINLLVVDEIKLMTGMKVSPLISTDREIAEEINRVFDIKEKATKAIEDFKQERGAVDAEKSAGGEEVDMERMADEVPVVRLVNSIIIGGIQAEASDIHLEPMSPKMRVRYRVDGILHDTMSIPRYIEKAAISRIKILGSMNIAEKRAPQDGQFTFTYEGHSFDVRVSTLPTREGEKVVMRILDKGKVLIGLPLLGMLPDEQKVFDSLINVPWGILLVSGPTGSGKTTTLYAALHQLNDNTRNIVTVEDPVEFSLKGINQVHVNSKAGVTFATGLRAILRQDPNVVMVGEIRDEETAKISVHASLTGQLVLSTIHTTDAPSVLIRLLEMGVEPYLVASTVIGVISQRLIRVICSGCREEYVPSEDELQKMRSSFIKEMPSKLFRGTGCSQCNNTGYKGRTGIFEIMRMTNGIRVLLSGKASAGLIREESLKSGLRPLFNSGILKVVSGITTLEEILRVAVREGD